MFSLVTVTVYGYGWVSVTDSAECSLWVIASGSVGVESDVKV